MTAWYLAPNDTTPQPRVGFSYRLSDAKEIVLRGGGGVFTGGDSFAFLAQQVDGNPPYTYTQQFAPGNRQPNVSDSAMWSPESKPSLTGVDLKHSRNTVYSYNLMLEKPLWNSSVLSVGYMGSQGRHLGRSYNLNEFLPVGALNSNGTPVLARTYPSYGDIIFQDSGASSSYNAGQISLSSSQAGPIRFKTAFTYARSIDDASSVDDLNWLTPQYPQDIRHLTRERGLSDFQHKYQLMTYGVLNMQRLVARKWMSNSFLGFSAIAMSGIPFTPQIGQYRPDEISNPFKNIPPGHYFNPAAFVEHTPTAQDPSYFGTLGRNTLIGPSSCELNLSFDRAFHVKERSQVKVRAELFNTLNRMVGFPNYDLTSPTAGEFRHYQNQPRYFVGGARYHF